MGLFYWEGVQKGTILVIARSEATKQPSWIATPGEPGLAMTTGFLDTL